MLSLIPLFTFRWQCGQWSHWFIKCHLLLEKIATSFASMSHFWASGKVTSQQAENPWEMGTESQTCGFNTVISFFFNTVFLSLSVPRKEFKNMTQPPWEASKAVCTYGKHWKLKMTLFHPSSTGATPECTLAVKHFECCWGKKRSEDPKQHVNSEA